jgi:hypothetical protein
MGLEQADPIAQALAPEGDGQPGDARANDADVTHAVRG